MNDKIIGLFEALMKKMLEWTIGPFKDLNTFNELIFGNTGDAKYYGTFTESQFGVIAQGMALMQSLSVAVILISIIMAGMRIASSGINPSNRTYGLEYFKDFIIVALLFFNLSTIFELIYTVNSMFVSTFSTAKDILDQGIAKKAEGFSAQGVLGGFIIGLCLLGLMIWANFYYMMRSLTLMLLTIMSPLAVALYLIPQTKGITGGLFKEYTGTVFVQSVHAALYWVVASLAEFDNAGISSIIMYMIFIPVSESIRSLLGLGGQMNDRLSKTAAMFGGSALMGVAGSVKGALNGQSVTQALRSATGQITGKGKGKGNEGEPGDDPKALLAGAGTDIGSTAKANRMLKSGEILSKAGKAVFGSAGAIAGSPMGPMGSVAMSTVGFNAGGVVGGVAGRAGMAGAELIGNRLKAGAVAGANKFKGIKNAESLADEKLANTLADDETTKWANENKDEFMKQNKERFPDIDAQARNKMWDKEVASKRNEFLEKARGVVGEMKSSNGKHSQATELVKSTVDGLTKDWEKNNKDQFMKDYDQSNPLPVNATKDDILQHNQKKEAAWQNTLANKKQAISDIASKAASKLGNGVSHSLVDKEEAVSSLTNDWAKENKADFMKNYDAKNPVSPNASQSELLNHNQAKENAWRQAISNKKQEYSGLISGISPNLVNGKSTIDKVQAVNGLTNDWAKNNKSDFMSNYDAKNPLPLNASQEEVMKHNQAKESAWKQTVEGKRQAFSGIVSKISPSNDKGNASISTEKFVNGLTNDWANNNKADFIKNYDLNHPLPTNASHADISKHNQAREGAWQQAVDSQKQVFNGLVSKIAPSTGKSMLNREQTVNGLTNDWANKNKADFMSNYDVKNPLSSNATQSEITQHNQAREGAWQQVVEGKRQSFQKTMSGLPSKQVSSVSANHSFINKEDFANEVGKQIGTVLNIGNREGISAVKNATNDVQTASLYSGKSVNTPYLTNQLASIKTNQAKAEFISAKKENEKMTEQQAIQEWNTRAPEVFKNNLASLAKPQSEGGLPKHIPLDHSIIGNSKVRGVGAVIGGVGAGLVGASGIKEVSQFMGDTKAGHFFKSIPVGTKLAWENRDVTQSVVTAGVESFGSGIKHSWAEGKAHVAENVIGKQAGFRNAAAYTAGIVGGVRGYKTGGTWAAGGPENTKAFGLKGFNPYNNAVNNQISEVADIQHMAQTVMGPNGQQMIAKDAIRMVTTASQTVIQVKDKSGQLRTVSRLASGDSSLKKGETIFQDLTLQDGQLAPISNVYSEDSGGGRIPSSRTINVNPNKIVANRNSRKNPRVIEDIQSYNQLVDSGQYYLKDAMDEMANIEMIVDRNRSYLVGNKDGKQYRISPYGPGDARLTPDEVKIRTCEVRNRQLVVSPTEDYTSSLQPKDLVPQAPPNKRNILRQQNDKMRNKAFVSSPRW